MIEHIWFDFSETLAFLKKENHDKLRYESYSTLTGRPITESLVREYEELYAKFSHSNSALFRSLGAPSNYWSERIASADPKELYGLFDDRIPEMLKDLSSSLPVSIFSNIQLDRVLPALGIDVKIFSHILSATMVKEPKPALDGYYKMIELSGIAPENILYIGDDVDKDVVPAKKVGIQAGLLWKESDKADYCFKNFEAILDQFIP